MHLTSPYHHCLPFLALFGDGFFSWWRSRYIRRWNQTLDRPGLRLCLSCGSSQPWLVRQENLLQSMTFWVFLDHGFSWNLLAANHPDPSRACSSCACTGRDRTSKSCHSKCTCNHDQSSHFYFCVSAFCGKTRHHQTHLRSPTLNPNHIDRKSIWHLLSWLADSLAELTKCMYVSKGP